MDFVTDNIVTGRHFHVKRIAVIGAGVMGPGIAIAFARYGFPVTLTDIDSTALESAAAYLRAMSGLFNPKPGRGGRRPKDIMAGIRLTTSLEKAAGNADFIIEAVKEELTVKSRLFAELEKVCPPQAILASNSSSLSIDDIVDKVACRDRIILTHFVIPAEVMPLVDVARGSTTSDETFECTIGLLRRIGKEPIIYDKVLPIYLVNSFNEAIMWKALDLLGKGVATTEEIDRVFTEGLGQRLSVMGPFKTMDFMGLDLLWLAVTNFIPNAHSDPRIARIRELVQAGNFGIKTGRGFYDYGGCSRGETMLEINRQLLDIIKNRPAGKKGGNSNKRKKGDDSNHGI